MKITNLKRAVLLSTSPFVPPTFLKPFFTTRATGQRTGLGLSLANDIVKAHGWKLKVETKEGADTTFIIKIPVA